MAHGTVGELSRWAAWRLPAILLWMAIGARSADAQCRCFFERPMDVVLILDTSDSMSDVIEAMKSGAQGIVQTLEQNVTSYQVGLVTYGFDDPKCSPLTRNGDSIIRAIDALTHFGNYEPIDQALEMALRQMKWRPRARKVIILIGDEPPDNNRRPNGIQHSYHLAEECAKKGITVHVVSATKNQRELPELQEIARRAKGRTVNLEGAWMLPSALVNLSLGYNLKSGPRGAAGEDSYGVGPLLVAKLDMGAGWNMDRGDLSAVLNEVKAVGGELHPPPEQKPTASGLPNFEEMLKGQSARHLQEALPGSYSWKMVGPEVSFEDLSKASVLYLSAHGAWSFPDALRATVRRFLLAGGSLFADDCCQDEPFDRSFRVEVAKLFPGAELRPIPEEHVFYNRPRKIGRDVPRELLGLQMGCRMVVVYSPIDLSCRWVNGPEFCKKIGDQDALDLGVNVLQRIAFYDAAVAKAAVWRKEVERPKLVIGQIRFDGFWDPPTHAFEPVLPAVTGGAGRAMRRPVNLSDPNLFDYPILYLTGHGALRLDAGAVAQLKAYLDRGGFLFAEACCGDAAFDRSFRERMEQVFPDGLQALPGSHPVFSLAKKITLVRGVPSGEKGPPALEGIQVGGRTAVIYSPCDLSAALLDHPGFVFRSVSREDAEKLLTNVFLYALSY